MAGEEGAGAFPVSRKLTPSAADLAVRRKRRGGLLLLTALAAAALLVSGCTAPPTATTGSGGAATAPPASAAPVSSNVKVVDGVQVVTIEAGTPGELRFAEADMVLQPGKTKFVVSNQGAVPHEFMLYTKDHHAEFLASVQKEKMGGGHTEEQESHVMAELHNIDSGKSSESAVIDLLPGEYEFACHVPGHYEAGMKGKLVVQGAAAPAGATPAPAASMAGMKMAAAEPSYTGPSADIVRKATDVPPPTARKAPATVRVDLETREVVGELADGVFYRYWTFNGTVPGPMLRVREGDTVELRLKNSADSQNPHSIDLHAATGPGGGGVLTQAKPGEEKVISFKALNPGLYVYHCATPHVPTHVANGMYGLILVEPKEGLPPVDREFYVVQGEWYTAGQTGEKGFQAFSGDKMQREAPEYVTFNGKVNGLTGANALKALVGERVRIYFGVGAFLPSSFHVIGEIFDKVYPEGALRDPIRDVQTTAVPAGGAAAVEFTLDVPGRYILVDHSLTRTLDKGAAGFLEVEGPENPAVFRAVPGGPPAG